MTNFNTVEDTSFYQHPLSKNVRTQITTNILRSFRHYSTILWAVKAYCLLGHANFIPECVGTSVVEALQETVDKYDLTNKAPDPELVALVLENTRQTLDISSSVRPQEFHKLCTGSDLRLEIIAWILAEAGRAAVFGLDTVQPGMKHVRYRFIHEMLRSSASCLLLCTHISSTNDITIWATFEHLLLVCQLHGQTGPPTWRALCDLSTHIYSLGMHKEATPHPLPFFILETRRRVFCHAYNADKNIATFLGRPPRLSKRHTDIRLPLDLPDADLTAPPETLAAAIGELDAQGWNVKGQYNRASWIRLRYASAGIREEILEYSHTPQPLSLAARRALQELSAQVRTSWDAMPKHFRYEPSVWERGDVQNGVCLMLVVVYLTHFYNEFMIQRLLLEGGASGSGSGAGDGDQDGNGSGNGSGSGSGSGQTQSQLTTHAPLLRVSIDLLAATLTTGISRDRTYDSHRDFLGVVVLFGIPSAGVLAQALQEQHSKTLYHAHTSTPTNTTTLSSSGSGNSFSFPPGISRAEIIRLLSVLISHLDVLGKMDSGAKTVDGNYSIWSKAAGVFTRVIDVVLDERAVVPPGPLLPGRNTNTDTNANTNANANTGSGTGTEGESGSGPGAGAAGETETSLLSANAVPDFGLGMDFSLDMDVLGGFGMGMEGLGGMDLWDGIAGEGGGGEWGLGDWTV
ncbi:hypothetical protein K491DRAFT_236581 [Lophiostoma macrostomum CBS 122681]|uniref:Xylanolytic transcriptional activator regulatory domain-containing protein n=1 Tax=Lophiostoma macrostomum CBS 122681 TaxID=1314788 RepID=A0A6A6THS8_9PLEO|nr:hypothetical protein K491DRAFT_236581 [Lophiostoma macrostomum CBS 122681]